MLNENAKKWVAALRSAHFKQGRNGLCIDDKYCCLGVAYRVYAEENEQVPFTELQINRVELTGKSYLYSNFRQCTEETSTSLLPSVRDWLGLSTCWGCYNNPDLVKDENEDYNWSLIRDNDRVDSSFNQIADIIESEPEGLFKKEASC
jgi:hypothetical protein